VSAAPLEPTVTAEGTVLTFAWQPPSAAAPHAYVLEADVAGDGRIATLTLAGTTTSLTVDGPPGRYWGRLTAVNAAGASQPAAELAIDVDATPSPCYGTPPLAPEGLVASVANGRVDLRWVLPDAGPIADVQQLVAGSAPGLDNLARFGIAGPATSFSATAPPGTYYVRVVAFNACGASPFSNEVTLVVP
jgi:hypothetical protein